MGIQNPDVSESIPMSPRLLKLFLHVVGVTQRRVAAELNCTEGRVSQLLAGRPCREGTWQNLRAAVARVLSNREGEP